MATTQNFSYPSSSDVTITGIGNPTGQPAPANAVYIAGEDPSGNLHGVQTDSAGNLIVSPLSSSSTVTVVQPTGTNLHAVIDASALPTGASTSALQTTGNTSLSSIDSKTPALGQALAAASVPVVLPAAQITALTPPTTVTVIQPTAANLNATVTGTVTVSGTTTVVQPTGTNLHTVVDSSALPTGAATSANQATEIASLSTIATQTTNSAGYLATISSNITQPTVGRSAVAQFYFPYSSNPVTTAAYVQVAASFPGGSANLVEIFDSSGQALIFAHGASGSETPLFNIIPGGNGQIQVAITGSTRLAVKAITGTANSGYLIVNLYQ